MNKFDALLNTRDKRDCFFSVLFYGLVISVCLVHLYLAVVLLKANSYETTFGLLDSVAVQLSFIGRIVLAIMSNPLLQVSTITIGLISALGIVEVSLAILFSLFLLQKPSTRFQTLQKRAAYLNGCCVLLVISGAILLVMLAYKAGSLFNVLSMLHIFAYGLIVVCGAMMLYNGACLISLLFIDYPDLMKIQVIEEYSVE